MSRVVGLLGSALGLGTGVSRFARDELASSPGVKTMRLSRSKSRPVGRRKADAVAREALTRRADEIVLVDPQTSGLGRLDRRRLRRRSAVPVSD